MSWMRKLRDYDNEGFEETFARAKRVSDFVGFLSRLAVLAILIGLVNGRMETAQPAAYWGLAAAWLCLMGLAVHFIVLVMGCVTKFLSHLVFATIGQYTGLKFALLLVIFAAVAYPVVFGMLQVATVAQSWGRQQAERFQGQVPEPTNPLPAE